MVKLRKLLWSQALPSKYFEARLVIISFLWLQLITKGEKIIRSDNSEAKNINQGLMSRLFCKHPSPLKSFISHSVMTFFPSLCSLGLVLSIVPPYVLSTHSLHNSTKKDLKSLWSDVSLLLCLFTSSAPISLQLTYLDLLWAHLFLGLPLPQSSHLKQSLFLVCGIQDQIYKQPPQSSFCFFNS